jgi:hypothetical protein
MAKRPKDPFDVKLSEDQERDLTRRLVDEIRNGKTSRSDFVDDMGLLDFYWSLYEQQSQRGISRDTPRYGSADLTSPIGTENVDALTARAVKTVFQEPLWIVEGQGQSAPLAPMVEEFMQWRQEAMRLQQVAKRVITSSLVETGAVFEVCEDAEKIQRVELVRCEPMRDELGNILLDAKDGKPVAMLDAEGEPVEPQDPAVFVEYKRTVEDYRRRGAYARRRSMKDFLFLPSHAEDDREVWGRATRFWLTLSEIKRREKSDGWKHVEALGNSHERETRAEHDRSGNTVQVSHGDDLVEPELWRVQFWWDLGKGLTCYTAVVSEIHDVILSLRCDWLTKWRTVYVNPFPCPYSVYGYSMIGTKLLTTIEEHTAWRNMNADRETLNSNAPIKVLHGEDWNPELQPFGAGRTIHVSNMNAVMPFEFEGISPQAMQKEQQCVSDAQRIIGLNDIAIGQVSEKSRTLGENEMATRESFTRTDDPIGNIQEAFEEVGDVIHAIEVMTLKGMEDGIEAPAGLADRMSQRKAGKGFTGTFTADMLDGTFRFKPRGSVDSADPNKRAAKQIQGIDKAIQWGSVNPHVQMRVTSPEFADAMMQTIVTETKPRDTAAFLKPVTPPPPPPMMGLPGAGPGGPMPPGGPGGGPPGGAPDFGGRELIGQLMQQMPGGVQ